MKSLKITQCANSILRLVSLVVRQGAYITHVQSIRASECRDLEGAPGTWPGLLYFADLISLTLCVSAGLPTYSFHCDRRDCVGILRNRYVLDKRPRPWVACRTGIKWFLRVPAVHDLDEPACENLIHPHLCIKARASPTGSNSTNADANASPHCSCSSQFWES
jgi:hypothetical protein